MPPTSHNSFCCQRVKANNSQPSVVIKASKQASKQTNIHTTMSSTTSSNSQGKLVKALNALALMMVLGCIVFLSSSNEKQSVSVEDRLAKFGLVEEDINIPTTNDNKKRALGKGKGSSYYDDYYYVDCVPLYPTPAPTKGKGKGKGSRQLGATTDSDNKERKLSHKGSKGKGSYSAAPVSQFRS